MALLSVLAGRLTAALLSASASVSAAFRPQKDVPLDPAKFRGGWGAKNAPGHSWKLQSVGKERITGTRFGPWAAEEEYHHVSRQTCRAYLRALWFNKISKEQPHLTRRDRRRIARVLSKLEYKETIA